MIDSSIVTHVEIRQVPTDFSDVYDLDNLAFGQDNEAKLGDSLRKSIEFIPELSLVAQLIMAFAHIVVRQVWQKQGM